MLTLHRSFLSPLVLFPLVWLAGALLSQVHLLPQQTAWTDVMFFVVALTPLAFICGGLLGSALGERLSLIRLQFTKRLGRQKTVFMLVILLVVGWAELIHQFVMIGGVPLLSANGNIIRFEQGGPTIILTNLLTVTCVVSLLIPERLLTRDSLVFLAIGALAAFGFALQGGRGMLVLLIATTVFSRWLFWGKPKWWLLFGGVLAGLLVTTLVFFQRSSQRPYLPFEADLYGNILPSIPFFLYPLVPVYIAVTTNFLALQGLVSYFPGQAPFGAGIYNSVGFDLFLPNAVGISSVSSSLTPPWVTSTVAGSFWADGGFIWLVVGMFLIGVVVTATFTLARLTGALGWCAAAGYFLYLILFSIYTNLWTQQVDWLMVIPLLVFAGAVASPLSSHAVVRGDPRSSPRRLPMKAKRLLHASLFQPILVGLLAFLCLLLLGLFLQSNLPKPLTATIESTFPSNFASDFMTNGDQELTNEPIYWLEDRVDGGVGLRSRLPSEAGPGTEIGIARVSDPQVGHFDVGYWNGNPRISLFRVATTRRGSRLSIFDTSAPRDVAKIFPLPSLATPPHLRVAFRAYSVATWSGSEIDLFEVYCFEAYEPCELRILSGESAFREKVGEFALPFATLEPPRWSIDFAGQPNLNLLSTVIYHDNQLDFVRLAILDSSSFGSEVYKRDLDLPTSVPDTTRFLLGRVDGSPAIYVVDGSALKRSDVLRAFPIPLPQEFK